MRTSQRPTKRFWYSVPIVMLKSADDREARGCAGVTSPPSFAPDDEGEAGEAEHEAEPLAPRHDAGVAVATRPSRVIQSAVSTGCRPTSSADRAGAETEP